MRRELTRLANESFDLLIVGGGVNGLATAWDAALRGLRVGLVERGDFGSQTSFGTLRVARGGMERALSGEVRDMRALLVECAMLLRMAPHLVEPFPFLIPGYGHGRQGPEWVWLAAKFRERIGRNCNDLIADKARKIPPARWASRAECLHLAPGLRREALTGGVIFHDVQFYSTERLVLSLALSAAGQGAALANYVEAVDLLRDGSRVIGVRVCDSISGNVFDVRARVTALLVGPWRQTALKRWGIRATPPVSRYVKGLQLVAPRFTEGIGLIVPALEPGVSALLRAPHRWFLIPWRGASLIGTLETFHENIPDSFRVTEREIHDLIERINVALPGLRLTREQIPFAFGGFWPLNPKVPGFPVRMFCVEDHARTDGVEGLISALGWGLGMARHLAEVVVNVAFRKLGKEPLPTRTRENVLVGGDISDFRAFLRDAMREAAEGLFNERILLRWIRHYGTKYRKLLEWVRRDPSVRGTLAASEEVAVVEIRHAVREEAAVRLSDVVFRRTELGILGPPARATLRHCAEIMAEELGWNAVQRDVEIGEVMDAYSFR